MAHAEQLRQAYALMQAGQKKQAGDIVQTVLEQDRKNVNAWWLLANLLEDEQRVRTCLQQILKLDPKHKGANQMLVRLDDSDDDDSIGDLFAQAETDLRRDPAKSMDAVILEEDLRRNNAEDSKIVNYLIGSIVFMAVVITFSTFILPRTAIGIPNGNPAQQTQAFFAALARQDFRVIERITCEANRDVIIEVERILTETSGLADQTLNMSGLGMREIESTDTTAIVRVSGTFRITNPLGEIDLNYENLNNFFRGIELTSEIPLIYENGRWRICTET